MSKDENWLANPDFKSQCTQNLCFLLFTFLKHMRSFCDEKLHMAKDSKEKNRENNTNGLVMHSSNQKH